MRRIKNKRLCIDGQLLQTTAWDRGMGKYVRCLLEAYVQQYGSGHITVILNSKLDLSNDRAHYIKTILPDAEVTKLELPGLTGDIKTGKRQAKRALDIFLKKHYPKQSIDFLILNLFTYDYCAAFPSNVTKLLCMYDLVPLAYWQDFSKFFGALYLAHLTTIFEADKIISISEATNAEIGRLLGVSVEKLVNIAGALITAPDSSTDAAITPVPGRYFMCSTADFPHKNNLNIVKAFSALNEEFGNNFYLVLTSEFSESSKRLLSAYSDNLIFCGKVDDQELHRLYKDSEAVVCLSYDEGLGLALFEAAYYNKPALASDITVFKEISKDAFYFADPHSTESIKSAWFAALAKLDWDKKMPLSQKVLETFTWKRAAERFEEGRQLKRSSTVSSSRTKLDVIMPSPLEAHTSLGQSLQAAHNALSESFIPNYFVTLAQPDPLAQPYFLNHVTRVATLSGRTLPKSSRRRTRIYAVDDANASIEVLRYTICTPGYILLDTAKLHQHLAKLLAEPVMIKLFGVKPTHAQVVKWLQELGNSIIYCRKSAAGQYIEIEKGGRYIGQQLQHIIKG